MRRYLRGRWFLVGLATIFTLAVSGGAFAAVSTDRPDYSPGSVVTISGDNTDGAGYLAGETVHAAVSGPNGFSTSCDATVGTSGNWSCQVTLPNSVDSIGAYSYTATGQTSGVSQSGTFTDSGCPSSNSDPSSRPVSPDLQASFTVSSNIATYKFASTNKSPSGGVPGLIEYCVYSSPLPGSANALYDSWNSGVSGPQGFFDFERPNGNPSNLPFDGSTQTVGTATWTAGVPASQIILLHINDAAECALLYGAGSSDTCFVRPGTPQQPTAAISTTLNRVNGNGTETDVTNGSVTVGATLRDHATVTTTVNPIPASSTVTFRRYSGKSCSGTPVASQTVPVPSGATSATVAASDLAVTASMVPGLSYNASFTSGNTASVPSAGPSPCEPVTVVGDTTPPSCTLTKTIQGPPTQIQVTIQDTGSGLKSIVVTTAINATVSFSPSLVKGTTSPIVATATKVNQALSSQVAFQVTDLAGNVTNCDPVLTTLLRGNGNATTLSNVPGAEHVITIDNGTPGLRHVTATVNGTKYDLNLKDGQHASIDIASSLVAGNSNTIVLTGLGPVGGSAAVMVWDGIGSP